MIRWTTILYLRYYESDYREMGWKIPQPMILAAIVGSVASWMISH